MAESISRDNYANNDKEDDDYDSSQQSNNQHTSSNNEKYDDPAILSCGSAQMDDRIRYEREHLLQLRNAPLSRKRPEYVLEGLSMRKLWCRTTDLMVGGEERTGSRSTNSNSHEYRNTGNGTSTSASTYLMPLFAVKRRPNETKSIRKPEGNETTSTTTTTSTNNAPMRRSVFMSGPQLTSVGGGNSSGSSALDRRIGSGRIPARDTPWEFRSDKEPIDQEFSFRPTGGLINLRERERNLSSESQQKLQQQHRVNQLDRDRDRDYRDDRYEKRNSYSRDYDRDKDRNGRMLGNGNLSGGNMRFSSGSHNTERRRMFSENRTEEPEWFSGGPTSQNDTIELRGFDEPEPDEQTSRTTDTTTENDDQVSLDNQSDNSNNNVDDCDVAEGESDVVEDSVSNSTVNAADEHNDTNNNDNINSNKGFMDTANNSADDFNFEDFLKMGLMTDLCQTNDEFKDNAVGESRFYRWFQRQSPTKEKSRRSSLQDDLNEGNQNNTTARAAEKYFAPISPAASTGSSNSLLEFIQLGKFDKTAKEDPNLIGTGRVNVQSNAIPNNVPGSVCSVEELEARMRTSGGKSQNEVRNQQHQQDMQAFKKLLSQISGNDSGMIHREQQQQQQQQAMGQATGLMQMLNKNNQQPPFMLNNQQHQRPQNMQPPIQRQMEGMQNVLQINQHLQQSRDEILKRPEAQMLIQSICNAEVTQNSLIQQLNNPSSGTRQRETILAVLNFISECAPRVPSPIMMPPVMQPQPGGAMLHGGGVPIPKPPTIQTNAPPNVGLNEQPVDVMQPHLLYQHHQAAQKQLRVSPLPNGIPQRIPSPRELQFHTQSIMQSALIKKKLEEQRENFRKRQEMQQQHQQQQQTMSHMNQGISQSDGGNLVPSSSIPHTQTSTSCASPAKQHNQHIASNSPTPLAFTPTSVLRKMTAEKDIPDSYDRKDLMGGGNKDLIKSSNLGQQIQQQIHQQQQQQQNRQLQQQQQQQQQQQMRANQIKWNQFNQPPSKPMEVVPAGRPIVKGGGLPMQMDGKWTASNVEFQQMRDQYLRKQQLSMGINNPGQVPLGNVMQQSQQSQPQPQQHNQQLPNLSQQQAVLGTQQMQHLLQHRQQQQRAAMQQRYQYQQMMHPQQQKPSGQSGNVLVNENHGMLNFGREGGLSPTSNQLARWFSPELLAQASAGKLPSLNIGQALSLEEFERSIQHSSATVHN